ncbi:MAG: MmcQ/YjbR family DNA-binding protein [Caulobacteraceae bacterium]|nr:MAG: MmcQ/YjbR family DNA-binding protein [Caulobacteraceae bacterium]
MATLADLSRAALALPGVLGEGVDFSVGKTALCWTYLARATPKGRREAVPGVVAIACDLPRKDMLTDAAPDRFFDDDHYRGYPAVLVRLAMVDEAELQGLLTAALELKTAPRPRRKRA